MDLYNVPPRQSICIESNLCQSLSFIETRFFGLFLGKIFNVAVRYGHRFTSNSAVKQQSDQRQGASYMHRRRSSLATDFPPTTAPAKADSTTNRGRASLR